MIPKADTIPARHKERDAVSFFRQRQVDSVCDACRSQTRFPGAGLMPGSELAPGKAHVAEVRIENFKDTRLPEESVDLGDAIVSRVFEKHGFRDSQLNFAISLSR